MSAFTEGPPQYARLPVVPGAAQLKCFGYAPGDYLSKCLNCGERMDNVDKRAIACKSCAEWRYRSIVQECAE